MRGRQPMLPPADMEDAALEVDLLPAQGHEFGHPEPMPIGEKHHGRVPMAMPPEPPCGRDQRVDFPWREIFAAPPGSIGSFPRGSRMRHGPLLRRDFPENRA